MEAPVKIFLQACSSSDCGDCKQNNPDDVTWSPERISEKDVEYVRTDVGWTEDIDWGSMKNDFVDRLTPDERDSVKKIAKHFYELGLKAAYGQVPDDPEKFIESPAEELNVEEAAARYAESVQRDVARDFVAGALWSESRFERVEGDEDGWFSHHDDEYMCSFRFGEPVKLPADVYVLKKKEKYETT